MRKLALLLPFVALCTSGCIKTAASIVTLPVKAVGKTVDWTTTSQSEFDRNYGRKMRKAEAREGKERKEWEKRCKQSPDGCGSYDGYRAGSDDQR